MKNATKHLEQVIQHIVEARQTLRDFYSIRLPVPVPNPPVSANELAALEEGLRRRKLPFPPSYRAFLTVCNGILAFDGRLDLLSTKQVLEPVDASLKTDFPMLSKFVIGSGNTSAFISFDPETVSKSDEMEVVWVMEDGGEFRYPDFRTLLQMYRDELQKNLAQKEADRRDLPD